MKPKATRLAIRLLAVLAGALPALADENLLENGDFESGGRDRAIGWSQIWPRTIQDPAPDFGHPDQGAVSGESCATIETFKPGGYSSYTQTVEPKAKLDVAQLSGWIRVDELGEGAKASLMLLFLDEEGETLSMHHSPQLTEVGDWSRVQLEVAVPPGAERWLIRCGVLGQGKVAFDGVELLAERLRGEHVEAHLAAHFGTYVVRTENTVKEPWIAVSIPFPFERQTPLAIRVTSDPPELVESLSVLEDGENRPLKVKLRKLERDAEVKLRIETLAMVIDRPLSDGAEVKLSGKKRVPKEIRPHLEAAPGIDAQAEEVRRIAEEFDRQDLASVMMSLTTFLKERMTYAAGSGQGAKECLERGKAVCTGYANVAASLLIAADVPTRILASTQLEGRLQEHYIVEAWTPELGWSRLESTMARFPWSDSRNLILRVVYPEAFRSPGDVPLYFELANGVSGGFHLDPEDKCWQGADRLASRMARLELFEGLEEAARKAYAGLLRKPSQGATLCLVPRGKQAKKLKLDERTARILADVEAWLAQE